MQLQDAGLFKLKDPKAPGYVAWDWNKIKDTFNLVNENHNPLAPQDISYVYNGYSPISVKLIDLIFEAGGVGNLIAQKKNHFNLIGLT